MGLDLQSMRVHTMDGHEREREGEGEEEEEKVKRGDRTSNKPTQLQLLLLSLPGLVGLLLLLSLDPR